uniref:Serine/threonine protein kinase n=1 Tax=Solibacter usitatus (strain Ellin6076) TaxID=234267 RepID=Q02AP4_SOLUE
MSLSRGDKLGPYEILAPIGAGGMGAVYKALDTRLNREVAIKTVSEQHMLRFDREARAIAALNHPHICALYDVGDSYLVMEYVEGSPLKGPVPVPEAVRLATQIVEALAAAHAKGIIHRDLKPGNVLLTASGVKLLDFGLAKFAEQPQLDADSTLTQTGIGTVLGTASYMSPEQAQGRPADSRSDVFSFGAVLYELLCGKQAFHEDTAIGTIAAVVHKEPAPLQAPPDLTRIISRCLSKAPCDRFQTMSDLKAALAGAAQGHEATPSIAVLPFANLSPDKENEYFSDGLTEEIISALSHIPGLKVIARTSAFAFKGRNEDVRRIADTLGVTHMLEGSVRRSANRIRVTAELINACDGSHQWSERYDRQLEDVFAVQDEIAVAIARTLRMKLAAAPRAHTPKLAAYEQLLMARHYLGKWSPDAAAKGQECLKHAIALDPSFAVARCELAWFLFVLVSENRLSPSEAAALMKTEAEEALTIDPSLPEAHAVLGAVAVLDYNWAEAGRRFELAMSRDPIQPSVRGFYSLFYLAPMGRLREAEEQIDRLLNEDPLNLFWGNIKGDYLWATGRAEESEARQKQVLELDPNYWLPYGWLGAQYLAEDRIAEALEMLERAHSLAGWNPALAGWLAGLLDRTGNKARAQAVVESFGDGAAFGATAGLFAYYATVRDMDRAAHWFEKAIEQRDTRCPWIFPHMLGDTVSSNPHWPRLAKMMNLPRAAATAT